MTKKLFVVVFIFSLWGFSSCGTTNQNAKDNLDWDGLYTGTVPGADSAIHVELTLKRDGTYNASYRYDKNGEVFTRAGRFTWKDHRTVELDNKELPPYYLAGKNTLTQLDTTGKKISGAHADMYVLRK